MKDVGVIVIGSLNTDIIASGLGRFPNSGELVYGNELLIAPGGKSRNIAAMAGLLLGPGKVAMIGRTVEDGFGLYRPPIDDLHKVGVNTDFVKVLKSAETDKLPAVALISVNTDGRNQIVFLPGVSSDFAVADIDRAGSLYDSVEANKGYLVATLECPPPTMNHAIRLASERKISILLDPGGIQRPDDIDEALRSGIYLLKPNEHEAEILTGIKVTDLATAERAAGKLYERGARNVLITHGEHGAYLFSDGRSTHIPVPVVSGTIMKDATGCGDQTMAAILGALTDGSTLEQAVRFGVAAGTLQFSKQGVRPLSKAEISLVFERQDEMGM